MPKNSPLTISFLFTVKSNLSETSRMRCRGQVNFMCQQLMADEARSISLTWPRWRGWISRMFEVWKSYLQFFIEVFFSFVLVWLIGKLHFGLRMGRWGYQELFIWKREPLTESTWCWLKKENAGGNFREEYLPGDHSGPHQGNAGWLRKKICCFFSQPVVLMCQETMTSGKTVRMLSSSIFFQKAALWGPPFLMFFFSSVFLFSPGFFCFWILTEYGKC